MGAKGLVCGIGLAAAVTAAAAARAQQLDVAGGADPVASYCEYLRATAASTRAVLAAPALFGATGPIYTGTEDTGDQYVAYSQLDWRVTAGLQLRVDHLARGILTGQQAEAECARYRARVALRDILAVGDDLGRLPAVEAQLAVVEGAIPRAEEHVTLLERGLEVNLATVDELYGARLQVDSLRRLGGTLRAERERLAALPGAEGTAFASMIAAYDGADDEVERIQGRLRRNAAWAVDVRAGYDQLLGQPRDLPLFAQLRLSYSLGGPAQLRLDRRAAESRRRWRGAADENLGARVEILRGQLTALADAERRRLAEVAPLIDDVQRRIDDLGAVDTDRARKVREGLWLDFVRLDAERAYLEAHLSALVEALDLPRTGNAMAPVRSGEATTAAAELAGGARDDEEAGEGGGEVADTGVEAAATEDLIAVPRDRVVVTRGTIGEGDRTWTIDSGKVRAVVDGSTDQTVELRFTYLGQTLQSTELGSGATRQQIGLKLRASDGCNLVYVMWRIAPESQIVVSTKSNPGKSKHKQCGTDGYTNYAFVDVPQVARGEHHVLRVRSRGRGLVVWADGREIWRGELGPEVDALSGHPGLRTDNVHVTLQLLTGP